MSLDAAPDADAAAAPGAPARAAPATLALFVGAGCRPGPGEFGALGRDGTRCVWSAHPAQAERLGALACFDALIVDAAALAPHEGQTLARLRAAFAGCPLVVVAERGDEVDEIVALELGADAFLARPLAPRRLRAHLAALWRLRTRAAAPRPAADVEPARIAGWWLDRVRNRLVAADGRSVAVTELQAALLQCLLAAQGRALPRAQLAAALPLGRAVGTRSVDVYMHRLRARLAGAGVRELVLDTVRGRGYLLRAAAGAPAATPGRARPARALSLAPLAA
jgi:DNA-binding response OmpR family regulator